MRESNLQVAADRSEVNNVDTSRDGRSSAAVLDLVVYTAVVGPYDVLLPPPVTGPCVRFVCVGDEARRAAPGWSFRAAPYPDLAPQSRNRWAKFHPHLLFPEATASIYVDGNIAVLADPTPLAAEVLQRGPIGFYEHPVRTCLFDEARECALIGFDWGPVIRRQVQRYAADGYPERNGLYEGNVIVRAHHDPAVVRAMERWWNEWEHGVKRDQLSLMYVLWKEGLLPCSMGKHDARFINQYFRYGRHHKPSVRPLWRQVFNRAHLLALGMA